MHIPRNAVVMALFFVCAATVPRLLAQGPPFQTDDPVPVDFKHYEFYIFGITDSTQVVATASGPAFEFNWGALPRVQLHAVLPFGVSAPLNNPVYAPAGQGATTYGLLDMEFGAKFAFIKESKYIPQIGSFTMIEVPTGSFDKGLGIGKAWYKLPIWLQKNKGKWLFDGGAGYEVVPQDGYRNFAYTGWLIKRQMSERLELGAEVFAHGPEGEAAPQIHSSAMIDVGGYYHFKSNPNRQFLFCYGHSISGQTENYAYVGMYWTWGKNDKAKDQKDNSGRLFLPLQRNRNGL